MPSTCTYRRRRRDSAVELSRIADVSAVVTQFTISCAVEQLRLVTSDDIMTSFLKKLSTLIKFHVVKPLWSLVSFQIVDRIRRHYA